MGFADRQYNRENHRGGGAFRLPGAGGGRSVVWWLIAINVGVFLLDAILLNAVKISGQINVPGATITMGPLEYFGHFSAATSVLGLQMWRFITFQFLHAGISHLFFNMLGLYFFGPMIEHYLGSRRFLAFYLLCGIGGVIAYLIFWAMGVVVSDAVTPLVGASAGIFGILIAAARIAPNTTVMLLFPPIPLRLRTLAWILVGVGAYTVLQDGPNAGGEAAHLGGAALGFILIRNVGFLNFAERLFRPRSLQPRSLKQPTARDERSRKRERDAQQEIDRILSKVKDQGLASLTDKEKKTLLEETKRQQRVG